MFDKVIFLDFDGVLITRRSRRRWLKLKNRPMLFFKRGCVSALKAIVKDTGAKIVVSSTWRRCLDWPRPVFLSFAAVGWVDPPIIDRTPSPLPYTDSDMRGTDIAFWLACNPVSRFLILDDNDDMLPNQMDFFVKISGKDGLTRLYYDKCVSILGLK